MAVILKTFARSVSSAGTAVPLSQTRIFTAAFVIRANLTNTGNVYLGDSSVDSTNSIPIQKGETSHKAATTVTRGKLELFDLSKIYIDSDYNGEGVRVEYLSEE